MVPRCPSIQLKDWGGFWLLVPADDDGPDGGGVLNGSVCFIRYIFHLLTILSRLMTGDNDLIFLCLLVLVPDDFRSFQVCHTINPNI